MYVLHILILNLTYLNQISTNQYRKCHLTEIIVMKPNDTVFKNLTM